MARTNIKDIKNVPEYERDILDIARVTRTVAGGRRFSFRATVAIGNKQGLVGIGVAKGSDVAQSIDKAYNKAQKRLIEVPRDQGTIPIDVIGHFKSARVLLRPASKGRGLIAGGVVRSLCNLSGIENISAKILSRTNNKINIAKATIDAFSKINQYQFKLQDKKPILSQKENSSKPSEPKKRFSQKQEKPTKK